MVKTRISMYLSLMNITVAGQIKRMRTGILISPMCLLCGCASFLEPDEGWRLALVLQVGGIDASFGATGLDCRKGKTETGGDMRRYAYVRYTVSFAPRHAIVQLPPDISLVQNERIYVNVRDCGKLPARADPRKLVNTHTEISP